MDPITIFVSYSRIDMKFVDPIVKLLQAVPAGGVFQDRVSIPAGEKWRPVITAALSEARVMLVFWCHHSRESDEVRNEYTEAIERNKSVVPVIMDSTPLSPALSQFQGIDLSHILAASHDSPNETIRRFASPVPHERLGAFDPPAHNPSDYRFLMPEFPRRARGSQRLWLSIGISMLVMLICVAGMGITTLGSKDKLQSLDVILILLFSIIALFALLVAIAISYTLGQSFPRQRTRSPIELPTSIKRDNIYNNFSHSYSYADDDLGEFFRLLREPIKLRGPDHSSEQLKRAAGVLRDHLMSRFGESAEPSEVC